MSSSIEERVGGWLAGVVTLAARRPGLTLLVAALLTLASGAVAWRQLGVNANTDDLFEASLPFRRNDLRVRNEFPLRYNNLLVVIDAPTDVMAGDAARELAKRVEEDPKHFEGSFAPGSGPFWEKNGLLYLHVADLEQLSDDLAGVQPFLAELARDPSIRGLFHLLTELVQHSKTASPEGIDLEKLLGEVVRAVQDAEHLQSTPLHFGQLVLRTGSPKPRRFVLVRPHYDYGEFLFGKAAITRLQHMQKQITAQFPGTRIRMTGERALEVEEFSLVEGEAALAGISSFVLVALILWYALRSSRLIASTLITLVASLVWTAGFAALAVGHLNVLSIAFAVLIIGLGVDFGTHFCLRYRELRVEGEEHLPAMGATARSVGSSLLLCSATTAIGFYAFVPTRFSGVAELGLIAGTGMIISLIASLTVLPAVISLGLRGGGAHFVTLRGGEIPLPGWPMRHPGPVCAVALLLAVGAGFLAPRLRFDANPLHVRDPRAPAVKTFFELLKGGELNPWSIEVIEPDLAAANAVAKKLERLPSVDSAVTLSSYVPDHQAQKLDTISDMALFLGLSQVERVAPPTVSENLDAVARLRKALLVLEKSRGSGQLAQVAGKLAQDLGEFRRAPDVAGSLHALRLSLVDPAVERVDLLRRSLQAQRIDLGDLPKTLRERMLSKNGNALVEVNPRGNLNEEATVERFVKQVKTVAPNAAGSAVFQIGAAHTVVSALEEALTLSGVLVTLLLLLLWRSVRDTLLVLAPLVLAALFTAAIAVLIDLPINFANVIVIPLLIGIGIDSGIHLVHRYRELDADSAGLMGTSTSRAVLWSALTTAGSFASLAFASHRGLATLGQLLTLGVAVTLACNLLLLPALLELTEGRRRR